jgi:hypothetical protein
MEKWSSIVVSSVDSYYLQESWSWCIGSDARCTGIDCQSIRSNGQTSDIVETFSDNNKPLVDCWPKWDPMADCWANDDLPLAPCLLLDKEDFSGINTPSPPQTGGTGWCRSRRYQLQFKQWCAGEIMFGEIVSKIVRTSVPMDNELALGTMT